MEKSRVSVPLNLASTPAEKKTLTLINHFIYRYIPGIISTLIFSGHVRSSSEAMLDGTKN